MAYKVVAGIKGGTGPQETITYYAGRLSADLHAAELQEENAPDPEEGDILYSVVEVKTPPRDRPRPAEDF